VITLAPPVLSPDDRRRLGRRAQLLAAASVSYNLLEAGVAVAAGVAAGSVALVGFGLDALVEVGSGLVILWQFRHPVPQSRERRALRLIGASFLALAGYVTVESLRGLLGASEPAASPVGIGLAALSLLIMPALSRAQRRTGRALGSGSVVADSAQTLLCTYLSAVLLGGLLLDALLGWGWADPAVGLVIAAVAAREGIEAWRGENCGCDGIAVRGSGLAVQAALHCAPGRESRDSGELAAARMDPRPGGRHPQCGRGGRSARHPGARLDGPVPPG
jgi:hypothetical protein